MDDYNLKISSLTSSERPTEYDILKSATSILATNKTIDDLAVTLRRIFKGKQLVTDYFVSLDVKLADLPVCLYDISSRYADDQDLSDLIRDSDSALWKWHADAKSSKDQTRLHVEAARQAGRLDPWLFFLNRLGLKVVCGIPIRHGDHNFGVIWLHSSDHQICLFQSLATLISLTLSNIEGKEAVKVLTAALQSTNKHPIADKTATHSISISNKPGFIIGNGMKMKNVYALIGKVAPSYATVLITGETGTGKELIARAIHELSPRCNDPFIKVNCAALPPNLIESELFGHERGSFTGAIERRIGKFELANNGTLFLDEIGEMPLELQVKLLRVIQEKEIERVGGSRTIKVNVRLIAATNRNLQQEVANGRFRSDLFYRLNVFPVEVPSLRDRKEDIPDLISHFMKSCLERSSYKLMSISKSALEQLIAYHWPGNVRELEHMIERSILMEEGTVLNEVYLPVDHNRTDDDGQCQGIKSLEEMEREHIIKALEFCSGKISGKAGAAVKLGIPATTLSSKIARLKIAKDKSYH